jgi:hypothetical protein
MSSSVWQKLGAAAGAAVIAVGAGVALLQGSEKGRRLVSEWLAPEGPAAPPRGAAKPTPAGNKPLSQEGYALLALRAMGSEFVERTPYGKRRRPRGFQSDVYAGEEGAAPLSAAAGPFFSRIDVRCAYRVFEFLRVEEAERCRLVCVAWCSFLTPLLRDAAYLKRCAHLGFSPAVRGWCWRVVLDCAPLTARRRETYAKLLEGKTEEDEYIRRDVPRTQTHYCSPFFAGKEAADAALDRVLHCYAVHDPGVGYVQGSNFVAGFVLTVLPEADAYWVFYTLMTQPPTELRALFRPGLPLFRSLLFQLQCLAALYMPDLTLHLQRFDVPLDLIATEWFMTVFTYGSMPRETVLRVWDVLVVDGWKALIRVALAILERTRPMALALKDFESLARFYRSALPREALEPEALLAQASNFKVTNRALHRLRLIFEAMPAN